MSDQPTSTLPPAPAPTPPPGYVPAYAAAPGRPGWKDRVVGLRGAIGVALAALILGGAGGFALGHVTAAGDEGHGGRGGPGDFRGGPGGPPFQGGPGQFQGGPGQQAPPQGQPKR